MFYGTSRFSLLIYLVHTLSQNDNFAYWMHLHLCAICVFRTIGSLKRGCFPRIELIRISSKEGGILEMNSLCVLYVSEKVSGWSPYIVKEKVCFYYVQIKFECANGINDIVIINRLCSGLCVFCRLVIVVIFERNGRVLKIA